MKQLLATALGVVMALGVAHAQEPRAAAAGGVAQALIAMENEWGKASKTGNADALAPMLAEDFISLDADGTLHTKAEVLARVKKGKWTVNEIADMKATVHGDSAIVTGTWTGKGTDGAGKATDARERWADTWVKMSNGKWQCVASAAAPLK